MQRNIAGTRKYPTSPAAVRQALVQKRKDELLITLEKFFTQTISKVDLRDELNTIKTNIKKTCQ
jgi:hypothetical protein